MSETALDLNALAAALGHGSLKTFLYGSAGGGKTTNTVSMLAPYLAEGYRIIWVITEDNSLAGLRDGIRLYSKVLLPYLTTGKLFIADLRQQIAAFNKGFVGNATTPGNTAIAPGGPMALFQFLTEKPKVKDFTTPTVAEKNFSGLTNLTSLKEEDRVLLIIDGLTRVDANTAGFSYLARGLQKLETSPFAIAGLQKGGIVALQDVLSALTCDLVCLGHDSLTSVDLTDAISGAEKKEEAKEKRELQAQQLQDSSGFPAIATSSTRSAFLGNFGLVLHASDTRLASNKSRARFQYDFSLTTDKTTWYTRANLAFASAAKRFASQRTCPIFVPQDWTSSLLLTYLHEMNRLSEENLVKLLTLTQQQRLPA